MNSLIAVDDKGVEIFHNDETWVELDYDIYRDLFYEIESDDAKSLLKLIELSKQFPIKKAKLDVHFMNYDLPVMIMSSIELIKLNTEKRAKETPGLHSDPERLSEAAICLRVRYRSDKKECASIFPFIILAKTPPADFKDDPSLAHEMIHLRQAINEFSEEKVRLTFWNANLQAYTRANFFNIVRTGIISDLEDEWEACEVNFSKVGRQRAFIHICIPSALSSCASKIDWWLNDEKRYLNVGMITNIISDTVFNCLEKLGYEDKEGSYPMNAIRWKTVIEQVFRHTYDDWKKHPGPFQEKFARALES